MSARTVLAIVALSLVVTRSARGYQADLVPATKRIEARDIEGSVWITGADGTIRLRIESVNDAKGDFLDSNQLTVHLKVRVNGIRRRITIPLTVDGGDGEATESLGLQADDRVIVTDIRVRGPDRRTLAQAGVVTEDPTVEPPSPEPPPTPDACPAALLACHDDLMECNTDLDDCEQGF